MHLAPPRSTCDIPNASGARVHTLEEAEQPPPRAYRNLPPALAELLIRHRCDHPPHQLISLPGGRVHSHHGTVIDAENRLVSPLSREIQGQVRRRSTLHRLLSRQHDLPEPTRLRGRTLVLACASAWKNYFHWMIDALPRLRSIEIASFDHVFTPCRHAFQRETLALAGVDRQQIIAADEHSHIRADELVVPSLPPPGRIGSRGIDFLRRLAMPRDCSLSPPASRSCLFLGREDTWNRRIANAGELHAALETRGFRITCCSELSVREQAAHLRAAGTVLAPHGAALTNLLFCEPGTTVIECFASDYIRPHYHDIARLRDLDYHAHWTPGGNPAAQQWTLDIPGILELLDQVLATRN